MIYHTNLKINVDYLGHPKNSEIEVVSDEFGTPLDPFWRRRIKDSEIDNCVTVITTPQKKSKK